MNAVAQTRPTSPEELCAETDELRSTAARLQDQRLAWWNGVPNGKISYLAGRRCHLNHGDRIPHLESGCEWCAWRVV
jgi:hypothetical protein